jgi:hypothetical protein
MWIDVRDNSEVQDEVADMGNEDLQMNLVHSETGEWYLDAGDGWYDYYSNDQTIAAGFN